MKCYETVKKETISKYIFNLPCILKNEHQTELQTNKQHQIKTENMGLQQQICLQKTTERDLLVIAMNQFAGHG